MTTPSAELRASFDRYRIRIKALNQKILHKLLEEFSIPIDSTDPAHLRLIEEEEWRLGCESHQYHSLPPSVKTPNDIFPFLSDGTSPPLPEEKRSELFIQIEAALSAQAAPEFRPVRLPEDFKQLCALTDSITGPGLPRINNCQIPECLSGLHFGLFTLQEYGTYQEPLTVERLMREAYMDDEYEVGAGMGVGSFESRGGAWFCWCRSENEIPWDDQARVWKWRWVVVNDVENYVHEDVKEMLDESWDEFLGGIESDYGDIDVKDLEAIELVDTSVPESL